MKERAEMKVEIKALKSSEEYLKNQVEYLKDEVVGILYEGTY